MHEVTVVPIPAADLPCTGSLCRRLRYQAWAHSSPWITTPARNGTARVLCRHTHSYNVGCHRCGTKRLSEPPDPMQIHTQPWTYTVRTSGRVKPDQGQSKGSCSQICPNGQPQLAASPARYRHGGARAIPRKPKAHPSPVRCSLPRSEAWLPAAARQRCLWPASRRRSRPGGTRQPRTPELGLATWAM